MRSRHATYTFTYDIIPQPKLRPIVTSRGAYTPYKTKAFEAEIIRQTIEQSKNIEKIESGPITMSMAFVFVKPRTAKKRIDHTVKPDLDNLIKAVTDAMTKSGRVFKDDAQINSLTAVKSYGLESKIEVTLSGYLPHDAS